MENNEICMFLDVKLDIYDKRPESLFYKTWTKCEVKIQAIKCVPCFLRVTCKRCPPDGTDKEELLPMGARELTVSINVPGVSVSLAESRSKQYSYGLFWMQNRRDCYIYYAFETELSCRRHMKWMKKSIKNLELFRKVFLEERKRSRGPEGFRGCLGVAVETVNSGREEKASEKKNSIPETLDGDSGLWPNCVSRISEIYEEILCDGAAHCSPEGSAPRLSRRFSRSSIASGIYEEMRPIGSNFIAIEEEVAAITPPVPPLPPPRKRFNTFETDSFGILGELPRCNTNPESDLAKKKKYKNMLDNIFGSARSKRAESVSENQVCSVEDIINDTTPKRGEKNPKQQQQQETHTFGQVIYANEPVAAKRLKKHILLHGAMANAKRNSFSSPDLSKVNFLDMEEDALNVSANFEGDSIYNGTEEDLAASHSSVGKCSLQMGKSVEEFLEFRMAVCGEARAESAESLNISEQIPQNFNFSACNSSTINLIGANGAVALSRRNAQKNKIIIEDLTGYCIMAPIKQKDGNETAAVATVVGPVKSSGSTSSGYSTGSSVRQELAGKKIPRDQNPPEAAEESVVYEVMKNSSDLSVSEPVDDRRLPSGNDDFAGNLYENLLTIKAAQELEPSASITITTSTPTDSPLTTQTDTHESPIITATSTTEEEGEESYYQTPRRSIISIDDKIPSYYPNSCDTVKQRRHPQSPGSRTSPTSSRPEHSPSANSSGLRQLVNLKLRRGRKENLYISSPQGIIDQRCRSETKGSTPYSPLTETTDGQKTPASTSCGSSSSTGKANKMLKIKKTSALKISDNVVYAVTHGHKKSPSIIQHNNNNSHNNNNNTKTVGINEFSASAKEKLHSDLLHLAMLQKIDFKFDEESHPIHTQPETLVPRLEKAQVKPSISVTSLLNKAAPGLDSGSSSTGQRPPHYHLLQQSQAANLPDKRSPVVAGGGLMTQSAKLEANGATSPAQADPFQSAGGGVSKKFASLPRFRKIDFSPLKLRINSVLQRNQNTEF